jgi:hypothetical protein
VRYHPEHVTVVTFARPRQHRHHDPECYKVVASEVLRCGAARLSFLRANHLFNHPGGQTLLGGLGAGGGNSVIICVIGVKTAQFGFVPANLFCLILCGMNLRTWRKAET